MSLVSNAHHLRGRNSLPLFIVPLGSLYLYTLLWTNPQVKPSAYHYVIPIQPHSHIHPPSHTGTHANSNIHLCIIIHAPRVHSLPHTQHEGAHDTMSRHTLSLSLSSPPPPLSLVALTPPPLSLSISLSLTYTPIHTHADRRIQIMHAGRAHIHSHHEGHTTHHASSKPPVLE